MKINTRVKRIHKKISELNLELFDIQNKECTHEHFFTKNWVEEDEYGKAVAYWVEKKCVECGKVWDEKK